MRRFLWFFLIMTAVVDVCMSALVIAVALGQRIPIPWGILIHTPIDMALSCLGYWLIFGSLRSAG